MPTKNPLHTTIAANTLPLANRHAWRAICQALVRAGISPGTGLGEASRLVWAERKAQRRAARAERQATHQQVEHAGD